MVKCRYKKYNISCLITTIAFSRVILECYADVHAHMTHHQYPKIPWLTPIVRGYTASKVTKAIAVIDLKTKKPITGTVKFEQWPNPFPYLEPMTITLNLTFDDQSQAKKTLFLGLIDSGDIKFCDAGYAARNAFTSYDIGDFKVYPGSKKFGINPYGWAFWKDEALTLWEPDSIVGRLLLLTNKALSGFSKRGSRPSIIGCGLIGIADEQPWFAANDDLPNFRGAVLAPLPFGISFEDYRSLYGNGTNEAENGRIFDF